MKKIIFAMLATVAVLASCSKDNTHETPAPEYPVGGGASVELTLSSDPETRAFFSETAAAEPWEKEIKTLTVYVFSDTGKQIIQRALTPEEIAAGSVRLNLPLYVDILGKECSFYVTANFDHGDVKTVERMEGTYHGVTMHNGPFEKVSTECVGRQGFIMTGKSTAIISATDTPTKVAVSLKRIVAKVAVRVKMADSFAAELGKGTLDITEANLEKTRLYTHAFHRPGQWHTDRTPFSIRQTPNKDGDYLNMLFYPYENAPAEEGNRIAVRLSGIFDADGDPTTFTDRSNVEYKFELAGSGNGEIRRNAYYRVEATIKGLSNKGILLHFEAADWETTDTQLLDIGE